MMMIAMYESGRGRTQRLQQGYESTASGGAQFALYNATTQILVDIDRID